MKIEDDVFFAALTADNIRAAKNVYVHVTFNKNEAHWVHVKKTAIIHTLNNHVKRMSGSLDKYGDLWISQY